MTSAFVIRNQLGQYLTRKGEWVSGRDASALFHQPWYDQALNHLIETNSKDIELRGKVVELELDDKGRPAVRELGPDPQQPALLAEVEPTAGVTQETQPVEQERAENQTRVSPTAISQSPISQSPISEFSTDDAAA